MLDRAVGDAIGRYMLTTKDPSLLADDNLIQMWVAFDRVVRRDCADILIAAAGDPDVITDKERARLESIAQREMKDDLKKRLKNARKSLSLELRTGRKKLQSLTFQIAQAEIAAKKSIDTFTVEARRKVCQKLVSGRRRVSDMLATEAAICARIDTAFRSVEERNTDFPAPELGKEIPNRDGTDIPAAPGVYFLWRDDQCEYVGQTISLNQRLRLGSHHVMCDEHLISWVVTGLADLDYAECFYIGTMRPSLNFGKRAAHRRATTTSTLEIANR